MSAMPFSAVKRGHLQPWLHAAALGLVAVGMWGIVASVSPASAPALLAAQPVTRVETLQTVNIPAAYPDRGEPIPDVKEEAVADVAEEEDTAALPIEEQLEQIGSIFSVAATAAFPLAAAFAAVFAGLFLRKTVPKPGALQPMDMAASEVTPLSRRGLLAAFGTVPLVAATPAFAAKSGGRIGGSGFRSVRPSPSPGMAGSAVGGSAIGSSTVIVTPPPPVIVGPPVAVSPFGYGMAPAMPFSYGFSTGELLALTGIELAQSFAREQQRQQAIQRQLEIQRELGRDQAQIEALQQQLAQQDQRMRDLQAAMQQKGVAAPTQ